MSAHLIAKAKEVRDDGSIVEIVVWRLDAPLPPYAHAFKYRLFYGVPGECRVRYDNERGKGDHRHIVRGKKSMPLLPLKPCWRISNGMS